MKRSIIIFLLYGCVSCSTQLYQSNTANVPLLREKHESKSSIGAGNIQTSYAATRQVGIIANAFWNGYHANGNENLGLLGELGAGYFKEIAPDFIFETYGGIGLGRIRYFKTSMQNGFQEEKKMEVNGIKYFIQPSIGYTNQIVEAAFTPRISFVDYNNFAIQGYSQEEMNADYLNAEIIQSRTWVFVEPSLTLRAGYKWVKLQAQYGLTLKTNKARLKYPNQFLQFAVVVHVARWYRDRK